MRKQDNAMRRGEQVTNQPISSQWRWLGGSKTATILYL